MGRAYGKLRHRSQATLAKRVINIYDYLRNLVVRSDQPIKRTFSRVVSLEQQWSCERIVHRRALMTAITQWSQRQTRCAISPNADWLITPDANYILLARALADACVSGVNELYKHTFCSCWSEITKPGKLCALHFRPYCAGDARGHTTLSKSDKT